MKVHLSGLEFLEDFSRELNQGLRDIAMANLRYYLVFLLGAEGNYVIDRSTFARVGSREPEPAPLEVFDDFLRDLPTPKKDVLLFPIKDKDKGYGYLITLSRIYKPQQAILQLLLNTLALGLTARLREREATNCSLAIIQSAVKAIEAKDVYTRGHSVRVAWMAELLARDLGLPAARIREIKFASLLHDIGKIGISEKVLTKKSSLNEAERRHICLHPQIGAEILEPMELLRPVIPGVLYHHERFDGTGYPAGLSGENIPLIARIIAVADAYDAMTSTRSYRRALSGAEALTELRRGSGAQFDPALVEAFMAIVTRYGSLLKPETSQDVLFA